MLKMGSHTTITSRNTPLVGQQHHLSVTSCNHGFDCNTHSRLKHDSITFNTIVRNLRRLMHFTSNTMTCQFSHHTVALRFTMRLHSSTDVSNMLACDCIFNPEVKRFFGCLKQLTHFRTYFTYAKGITAVAIKSIQQSATIYRYDVAIFQDSILRRYTMHYYLVNRSAYTAREWRSKWIWETLECWDSPMISDKLFSYLVQLERVDSRPNMSA